MTTILISLGIIITYFIITAIKEGEATETIDRERRENNKKIANIHFSNLVEQELNRQKNLEEIKRLFSKQLESEDGIYNVTFEDDKLILITEGDVDMIEATEYAEMWINTFIPSTGINEVYVYNNEGNICGYASRDNL
jgi:hypothetical protein